MNKSGRSAWCRNTELSDHVESETTKEAPHGKYVLHWLRRSQENDQLLREGCKRPNSRRRQDFGDTLRPGPVDEDSSPAVDGSNGSHHLHRLDLRSPAAPCSSSEGSASADAAGHRSGQEEERPHRCQEDRRRSALQFSARVLHGPDGDSRAAAHTPLPKSVGSTDRAAKEQNFRPADGGRRALQQSEVAKGWLLR